MTTMIANLAILAIHAASNHPQVPRRLEIMSEWVGLTCEVMRLGGSASWSEIVESVPNRFFQGREDLLAPEVRGLVKQLAARVRDLDAEVASETDAVNAVGLLSAELSTIASLTAASTAEA